MNNLSTTQQPDAMTLIRGLDDAAYSFALDHNARRLPAAVAASMAGIQIPMEDALPFLEKALINDPHARDIQEQIREARKIIAQGPMQ